MAKIAIAALIAALLGIQQLRLTTARATIATALLAASNAEAARDSTRDVATTVRRVSNLLGDSLRLVEKRAVQSDQRGDALDRALGRERIERTAISAKVDSLELIARTAPVVDSAHTTRRAHFDLRRAPYTLAVDAALPPPPDSATVAVGIALDPLALDVRVGCAPPDATGIRAASVDVSAPSWARVTLGRVEQSASLCASPALATPSRGPRLRLAPLVVGLGTLIQPTGPRGFGLFAGAGVALDRL